MIVLYLLSTCRRVLHSLWQLRHEFRLGIQEISARCVSQVCFLLLSSGKGERYEGLEFMTCVGQTKATL